MKRRSILNAAVTAAVVWIACLGLGCAASRPSPQQFATLERVAGQGESEIVVSRPSKFTGSAVKFRVVINGEERLMLGNGETGTIVVPDGRHSIYANNGMASVTAGRKRAIVVDMTGSRIVFLPRINSWVLIGDDFLWAPILLDKFMEGPLDASATQP